MGRRLKHHVEAASRPRTFDDAFADHKLTRKERTALVWRLASIRAQRTVETLLRAEDRPSSGKMRTGPGV